MSVITYGSNVELPVKPRFKATVVSIPLSDGSVALRRGTNPLEDIIIHDRGRTPLVRVAALMDGSRDIAEISLLGGSEDDAFERDVKTLLRDLVAAGVMEDAAADSRTTLSEKEQQRYSRNLNCWSATILDGRTPAQVQSDLKRSHVLVLGVGGLGSAIAQGLAMAGCGRLTLADFDTVELQNLNRQCLYETPDVGKRKVEVAQLRLSRLNPDVETTAESVRIPDSDGAAEYIRRVNPDVVIGGADRPAVAIDRWLTDASLRHGVPYVAGAVSGAMGRVWTKMPGLACFNCDQMWTKDRFPMLYEVAAYRETHDVLPATSALSFGAQMVASVMGYEVIHFLLGLPVPTAGRILAVDFSTLTLSISDRPPHPACKECRQ